MSALRTLAVKHLFKYPVIDALFGLHGIVHTIAQYSLRFDGSMKCQRHAKQWWSPSHCGDLRISCKWVSFRPPEPLSQANLAIRCTFANCFRACFLNYTHNSTVIHVFARTVSLSLGKPDRYYWCWPMDWKIWWSVHLIPPRDLWAEVAVGAGKRYSLRMNA